MLNIEVENAVEYLRGRGWIGAGEHVTVRALTGGVSNQVLYVGRGEGCGADFVLKQARPQLRTPAPWFCGVERIWREVEVLRICDEVLGATDRSRTRKSLVGQRSPSHQSLTTSATAGGSSEKLAVQVPKILHEDRENFAIAMSAAPAEHRVWKVDLLAGRVEPSIAVQCGQLLGRLHAGTWNNADVEQRLNDRQIFDELRLDPYYRAVAAAFPNDASHFERLIASVWEHRLSMVHADFSPKNLLVYEGGLMMVDFETGHYGDPAFDLGFFLSHLLLKAVYHAPVVKPYFELTTRFLQAYREAVIDTIGEVEYTALVHRGILNLAGCMWARIDGKSRVEYLTDEDRRNQARRICRLLFERTPSTWAEALASVDRGVHAP